MGLGVFIAVVFLQNGLNLKEGWCEVALPTVPVGYAWLGCFNYWL